MRVVVTGAAGFVGSHLCERLVADRHEVIGIDGFIPESYPEVEKYHNIAELLEEPNFRLRKLDLRSDRIAGIFDGVDAVIHLAAMPGLPDSWQDLDLYTRCNLLSTGRLIEEAKRAEVRKFVHISTSSVYGRHALGDELGPLRPSSPYGLTKLAAEHLLLAHHENFAFPVTILRYFSIYGPRQRPDMAFHIFIESILDGRPITVFGDGKQARSNTYVLDCVDATVRALHDGMIGQTYNIGGGELVVLADAIRLIGELTGRTPELVTKPVRPGDQRATQADTTKAREHFGYVPRTSAKEGLALQLDWHLRRRRQRAPLGRLELA